MRRSGWAGVVLLMVLAASAAGQGLYADHPVNRWVKRSPRQGQPVPRFGWEGSGAFDPYHRLWIHHAGHDGIPQGFATFTWEPATGVWRQRFAATSPPGVCCVDGANVFDRANRLFVRFPGGSLGHGYQWSRGVRLKESAVWVYDVGANAWRNMRPEPYGEPPEQRQAVGGLNPAGAYDAVHDLAISFGGIGSGGGKSNLHLYDAYANRLWLRRAGAKDALWPDARDGCGLAFDARNNKLVMFGGQYSSDERTWLYDVKENRWEALDLSPRPPAKKGRTYSTIPKMTYDPVNGVVLCVVWLDEERGHETWALDCGSKQWRKMEAAEAEASKSRARNLDFWEDENVAVMETWSVKGEPQVWTYRFAEAKEARGVGRAEHVEVLTGEGSAELSWAPVAGASRYRVYRGSGSAPWSVALERVAETTGATWQDKGLERGQVYSYAVRAVGADGREGEMSWRGRTEARAPVRPVVSVLGTDRVNVSWPAQTARDVVGYNVYRGQVTPRVVSKGTAAPWRDNDPEYPAPVVAGVRSIGAMVKLNERPVQGTSIDDHVDLTKDALEGYRFVVQAYVVRAVNRLGAESGPSPYALTIPGEALDVMCRERDGVAELKWEAAAEQGVGGYHVYKLEGGVFGIKRVTERPIKETSFSHAAGKGATRYWVVSVDALGQEGQPSSPAWYGQSYRGFYEGEWHQ
jgi:fibronectin type 3 domain-containing protein